MSLALPSRRLLPLLLILLLLFPLRSQSITDQPDGGATFDRLARYNPETNYFPGIHWQQAATPEQLGWSSGKLQKAREYSRQLATDALVIIDNGIVVEAWGHPTERFSCRSIRKSLLSALYGIHVGNGTIKLRKTLAEMGIDDNQKLSQTEKSATIADLLSARSGVYHPAAYETETMREKRPERGSHAPGTFWYYNNWDFNALLTIFEQETRTRFFQDFTTRIAVPLQMEQFRPQDTKYHREKSRSRHPAYLFNMSALDLARFGLLYLRQGRWEDRQVIPADWVTASTTPKTRFNESRSPRRGYGYLWHTADEGYYAAGKGGSKVMIVPGRRLVIVLLVDADKGHKVESRDFWKLLELILAAKT